MEKVAMVEIDSVTSEPTGARITPKILATMMNITSADAKTLLNSLYKHGAIVLSTDEDGETRTLALLYKDSYPLDGEAKEIEGKTPQRANYDYDDIQEKWNKICPTLPPLVRITPKRRKAIRNCLSENGVGLDSLYKVFKIVSVTPFLNGESNQFKAGIDWLLKPANFEKILSGYYSRSYKEKTDYQAIMEGSEAANTTVDDIYK